MPRAKGAVHLRTDCAHEKAVTALEADCNHKMVIGFMTPPSAKIFDDS
jgi:hypothetical protein